MRLFSDLAVECKELDPSCTGVRERRETVNGIAVSRMEITSDEAAKKLGREKGRYVTLMTGDLASCDRESVAEVLSSELSPFIPDGDAPVLVVGLGNRDITPDALGPEAAAGVLATRHITAELAERVGLTGLKSVAVLAPGVLGQTGMETAEIIESAVARIRPRAVLAIDALTSRGTGHLCKTVQLSDAGISPGSGVRNRRAEISRRTLGVPVTAIGVPTVVRLSSIMGSPDGDMIVTPKDIDSMIDMAASVISLAVNAVLQPSIPADALREYLG